MCVCDYVCVQLWYTTHRVKLRIHLVINTINQSKQIYIVPCVARESEARDGRD